MNDFVANIISDAMPVVVSALSVILGYQLKEYKTTLQHKKETEVSEKDLLKMLREVQCSQAKLIAENMELKNEVKRLREIIERYEKANETKTSKKAQKEA